jgi:hypothetical protein
MEPVVEIDYAAWVLAADLSLPNWATSEPLPRLTLPSERTAWPKPRQWSEGGWFLGAWTDREMSTLDGYVIVIGAAWRR